MSHWKVIGKGDNVYSHSFISKYKVTEFLYGILADIGEALIVGDDSFPFDIEDDKIEVTSPNGVTYKCLGWHWIEDNPNELMMPDGESFYAKASRLYN